MRTLRLVPVTALLLGGVACSAVQPVRQPSQFIPSANPDLVVVIYKDNSQVAVQQPHVSGDTLTGVMAGEPVSVPLSEVQRIDAMQKSPKRTALMVTGLTAAAAGLTYAIVRVTVSGKNCDTSYAPPTLQGARCVDGSYVQ